MRTSSAVPLLVKVFVLILAVLVWGACASIEEYSIDDGADASAIPQPTAEEPLQVLRVTDRTDSSIGVDIPPIPDGPAPEPRIYETKTLYAGVRPVTYIEDTCEYLAKRWDPNGSLPGTIIVPVMYHAIGNRANRGGGDTYTPHKYFVRTMEEAKRLGYETVTAEEVADFLEFNARIPARSMILIADDRYPAVINREFLPILQANDWTVTLGWIIGNTDDKPGLWERLETMHATGHLDIQSHGLRHIYMVPGTAKAKVRQEILDPIPILEQRFGDRPIAFVWPGGNYSRFAVRTAEEGGYRIAFTANQRGPVMFNWIPHGKAELGVGNPLMLLPRYWSYPGMIEQLGRAADIGDAAYQEAMSQWPWEAAYYRQNCTGDLPYPINNERPTLSQRQDAQQTND